MGNQSVTKNQTGSVKPLEIIVPQVCGSFKRSRNRNRDFPAVTHSRVSARIIFRSASATRGSSCVRSYLRRQAVSHKKHIILGMTNANRIPQQKKIVKMCE